MFEDSLQSFIEGCQRICDDAGLSRPATIEKGGGKKFLRLVRVERDDDGSIISQSAYCFVALADGQNRKLGAYRQGDIFKPDGWKGPARTPRGNVFDFRTALETMSWTGPAYLRH